MAFFLSLPSLESTTSPIVLGSYSIVDKTKENKNQVDCAF
jgi:hypothetical protein